MLDASEVVIALEHLLAEQRANTAIDISLTQRVSFDRLPPLIEEMIYRIVQEALNNVIKHSGAKRADVVLFQMGDQVRITVRDDGRGFELNNVNPVASAARDSQACGVNRRLGQYRVIARPRHDSHRHAAAHEPRHVVCFTFR